MTSFILLNITILSDDQLLLRKKLRDRSMLNDLTVLVKKTAPVTGPGPMGMSHTAEPHGIDMVLLFFRQMAGAEVAGS
ncbi:MAG: hypothetical protein IIZ55_00030, partial [Firmicutes bacterium]|nr:hypothetical protein [Bacillota bacterium]